MMGSCIGGIVSRNRRWFTMLYMATGVGFALRFGSLVADHVFNQLTIVTLNQQPHSHHHVVNYDHTNQDHSSSSILASATAIDEVANPSMALREAVEDNRSTIIEFDEDDIVQRIPSGSIKESRVSKRPYGRYCSTEIINEQQLFVGARKKVIAYSLFDNRISQQPNATTTKTSSAGDGGKKKRGRHKHRPYEAYVKGLEANILGAKLYYPDWIVRVFTFDTMSPKQIDDIIQIDPSRVEIVVCHANGPLGDGRDYSVKAASRFLAYDDPSVHIVLSRDSDSRFTPRELMAVNEWLGHFHSAANNVKDITAPSDCFHTMKDHLKHLGAPVLAGLFGIGTGCLLNNKNDIGGSGDASAITMTSLLDQAIEDDPTMSHSGYDQYFLKQYIWPKVKSKTVSHDFHIHACRGDNDEKTGFKCLEYPLGPANITSPKQKKSYHVGETFRNADSGQRDSLGYTCTLECQQQQSQHPSTSPIS